MKFPRTRLRRLRSDDFIRRLTAESSLSPNDLLWPLFVHDDNESSPVPAMAEVFRLCADDLWRQAERALILGIPAVALFPVIPLENKTPQGEEALNDNGLIPRLIGEMKKKFPELGVMADVALDPYTSHGHDGVIDDKGRVLNDETVEILARQATVLAMAGADIVAPSDMMDGRIAAVRDALEAASLNNTKILSYAAKYASVYYGPFRDAVGSGGNLGGKDKRSYQMNPANRKEAIAEMRLDLDEGADMLLVKPGLPYLDIIADAASTFEAPVLAYQVSGEYAMLNAASEAGFFDKNAAMMESLLAFKRAGACAVLSYFAPQAAMLLVK